VIERRQDLRFAKKPSRSISVAGEQVRQDFQSDIAIELRIARLIHLAHPTNADHRLDLVRS
jgi:hypothetical protein